MLRVFNSIVRHFVYNSIVSLLNAHRLVTSKVEERKSQMQDFLNSMLSSTSIFESVTLGRFLGVRVAPPITRDSMLICSLLKLKLEQEH